MKQPYFEFTYEVDDGYVGGSRPQRVRVRIDDFDSDMTDIEIEERTWRLGRMTDIEIEERIDEAVADHMREHIIPAYDEEAVVRQIRSLLDEEAEGAES